MTGNCTWVAFVDRDGVTRSRSVCCKHVMNQPDPSRCFAQCRKKQRPDETSTCRHLRDQVGEILTDCETCHGRVRIKQPAHRCVAFGELGRCLPTYVPADLAAWQSRKPESDIYHLCHGCDRFESIPPTPGAE